MRNLRNLLRLRYVYRAHLGMFVKADDQQGKAKAQESDGSEDSMMVDIDMGAGGSDFEELDSPPPQPKKRVTKSKTTQNATKTTAKSTAAKRKDKAVQVRFSNFTLLHRF